MRSSLVGVLIAKRARRLEVRKHRSAANDARQAERSRRGIPRCGSLRVGGAQHELWGPASPGRSKPQACACPTGSSTACASRCGPRLRRRCIAELRVRGSVRGSDRRQNGATNRRHYSLEFGLSTAVGGTAQQAAAHATGLRSERSRVRITPGALSFLGSAKPVPATGRFSGSAGAEAPFCSPGRWASSRRRRGRVVTDTVFVLPPRTDRRNAPAITVSAQRQRGGTGEHPICAPGQTPTRPVQPARPPSSPPPQCRDELLVPGRRDRGAISCTRSSTLSCSGIQTGVIRRVGVASVTPTPVRRRSCGRARHPASND